MTPQTTSHIVAIRRDGVIEGHQLRVNGGGTGHSKFFAAGKFGGADKALRAAKKMAKGMGLPKAQKRGGSTAGRLLSTSQTREAGIRFECKPGSEGPLMRVVATWTDRRGESRHTSFSVQRHGLAGALEKAIAARISCGAPLPDYAALLKRLRQAYRANAAAGAASK